VARESNKSNIFIGCGSRAEGGNSLHRFEKDRRIFNRPAGGIRSQNACPYSSQPARTGRKLLPTKIFFLIFL
jgi:hypothetical protein